MNAPSGWTGLPNFGLVVVFLLGAALWSKRQDRLLRQRHPELRPFVWGYFAATVWMAFCIWVSVFCFLGFLAPQHVAGPVYGREVYLASLLISAAFAVVSWRAYKRRRWAWVILTVASGNALIWIFQGLYVHGRWAEMALANKAPPMPAEPARGA